MSTDNIYDKRSVQVTSDLFCMRFTYYNKDNQQVALGLATDSSCGVLGRGWTTFPLYDGPLLGLGFWLSVGVKVWYGEKGPFSWFFAFIHVL